MEKNFVKKLSISLVLVLIALGAIFVASSYAICDVAYYRYGSSVITAYARTEGIKDGNNGWNNHLEAHYVGYQIKSDGKTYREDGGNKVKDNASSVESRIWVDWGRGTTYTNTWSAYCRFCGTAYGAESHTFAFTN